MRRITKFLFLLTITATVLLAQSDNLLTNGNFETSSQTGWNLSLYNENSETDTAQATKEIDTLSGTAKEGKGFMRITVTKGYFRKLARSTFGSGMAGKNRLYLLLLGMGQGRCSPSGAD